MQVASDQREWATCVPPGYNRPVVSRPDPNAAAGAAAFSGRCLSRFLTYSNRQGFPARVNQRLRFRSVAIALSEQPPACNVSLVVSRGARARRARACGHQG